MRLVSFFQTQLYMMVLVFAGWRDDGIGFISLKEAGCVLPIHSCVFCQVHFATN